MRKALLLLTLLALVAAGCASPENRAVLHYIKAIGPYEQSLSQFKAAMVQVQARPIPERGGAYTDIARQVRERKAELEKVETPPPAAKMQESLLGLYDVLGRYLDKAANAGFANDPELQQLAAEWQQKMKATDDELSRLSARYQ